MGGAGVRGHEGDAEGEGRGAGPEEGHEVSSWDHGAPPLSRSGSLVRGRLHTLVERGRHGPFLWTVEHRLLYIRCERIGICEVKIHTQHSCSLSCLVMRWSSLRGLGAY